MQSSILPLARYSGFPDSIVILQYNCSYNASISKKKLPQMKPKKVNSHCSPLNHKIQNYKPHSTHPQNRHPLSELIVKLSQANLWWELIHYFAFEVFWQGSPFHRVLSDYTMYIDQLLTPLNIPLQYIHSFYIRSISLIVFVVCQQCVPSQYLGPIPLVNLVILQQ